ncbi:MAG: BamA/TamA family outer membrane protein [Flammeovirgaceae bacterium]|nr:BamA/TamA family outer membrane protein [Flammeovirgaceae bacterium]
MSIPIQVFSQKDTSSIQLKLEFLEDNSEINKKYPEEVFFKDSISVHTYLSKIEEKLILDGFLAANIDEVVRNEGLQLAKIYVGKQYEWFELRKGNLSTTYLEKSNVHLNEFKGKSINLDSFKDLTEKLLRYAENHGFPFAKIELDSVFIKDALVNASLQYKSGSPIFFDSLFIISNTRVNSDFLAKHLQFYYKRNNKKEQKREVYNQKKVDMIPDLMDGLPFWELAKKPEVVFEEDIAVIKLYVNQVPSNQIDALVGLLPKSSENEKVNFTGQFELNLLSPFGKGKNIYAKWQKVKPKSPVYKLHYEHPYFFNTNFKLGVSLNSLQEDTLFRNLDFEIGMGFKIKDLQNVRINYYSAQSNILDRNHIIEGLLQGRSKTNFQSFGILYEIGNRRSNEFSKSNFYASLNIKIGNKKILLDQSDSITNFIENEVSQTILSASLQKTFRVNSDQNVFIKQRGGLLLSKELYLNDLFRLGGFNLLRGFNENQFYASSYLVNTIEWHLTFDKRSYFFVFCDQALMENKILDDVGFDIPIGLGTGFSLKTKPGIFTLMWSMGKSMNQNFSYKTSKIHFGLINMF